MKTSEIFVNFDSHTEDERHEFMCWVIDMNNKLRVTDTVAVNDTLRGKLKSIVDFGPQKYDPLNTDICSQYKVPTDILWNMTFPIPNINISRVPDMEEMISGLVNKLNSRESVKNMFNVAINYTIHIFETEIVEFLEYIETHNTEEINNLNSVCVGSIKFSMDGDENIWMIVPIFIHPNSPNIIIFEEANLASDNVHRRVNALNAIEPKLAVMLKTNLIHGMCRALMDWYTIQLLMLNPIFKVCINDKARIPITSNRVKKNKKKRPIRYMRKVVIDAMELDNILYSNHDNAICETTTEHKYTRHTMLWHVAGHWYERNGKRHFRQGHWKGPLAESMKSNDGLSYEARDREVVMNPLLTKKDE